METNIQAKEMIWKQVGDSVLLPYLHMHVGGCAPRLLWFVQEVEWICAKSNACMCAKMGFY